MNAQSLRDGTTFEFNNEDETMHMNVSYENYLGKYVIELNGKFMCTSKTYAPMLTRLNNLKRKHGLIEA